MTTTLQARVAEELAEAARRRADDQGMSLSRYLTELVQRDLAKAQDEAFWRSFTDYYSDASHVAEAQAEAESYGPSLADGLEREAARDDDR